MATLLKLARFRHLKFLLPPLLAVVVAAVFFLVANLYQNKVEEQARSIDIERLAEVRAKIEGSFNGAVNLTAGLIAQVKVTGRIEQEIFDALARYLLLENSLIRNITLAPDNVVGFVYPLTGNEAVLGMDLLHHPQQGEATREVMATQRPVLAGPYNLVQGGVGVIHRVPIYIEDKATGQQHYWGLMSTPIDFTRLLEEAGLFSPEFDLEIALRRTAGSLDDAERVFYGEPTLFEHPERLSTQIAVLDNTWEMVAVPQQIISQDLRRVILLLQTTGLCFALLTFFLTWKLIRLGESLHASQERYKMLARHDSLTGLPNRTLFYDRFAHALARAERRNESMALLYMDLDGFKPINDQYGHPVGDQVLQEVARRFSTAIRGADSVIRIGGDEFVVLIEEPPNEESIQRVAEKLIQAMQAPFQTDGTYSDLGVSIGIAIYPENGLTLDELMNASDSAMYAAKAQGSNQIHWAS
ncbi:diguanylate cyclase domain-containing protein [Nitrincola tapanii]|uniref:Sensor domain-containing diguanylate cyclase n=1 Tax=Nitrincola tapanii TaxID=1708751 RepID=A0A5A9W096_9GAMM|nr:diguanylate cyclase [Nitrincola tapanii]KAA0874167.1 sensor domain-containing diguanylate cyclase [Nitrincola tapanii]